MLYGSVEFSGAPYDPLSNEYVDWLGASSAGLIARVCPGAPETEKSCTDTTDLGDPRRVVTELRVEAVGAEPAPPAWVKPLYIKRHGAKGVSVAVRCVAKARRGCLFSGPLADPSPRTDVKASDGEMRVGGSAVNVDKNSGSAIESIPPGKVRLIRLEWLNAKLVPHPEKCWRAVKEGTVLMNACSRAYRLCTKQNIDGQYTETISAVVPVR